MTKYVKEEYIRKYADKTIVDALDKSIEDHLEYAINCHKSAYGEEPTTKEMENLIENAHNCAMSWLNKNYYLQYIFDKDDPDYECKMKMKTNYQNLVSSMSKEEIKKEDDIFEASKKHWDNFLKDLNK